MEDKCYKLSGCWLFNVCIIDRCHKKSVTVNPSHVMTLEPLPLNPVLSKIFNIVFLTTVNHFCRVLIISLVLKTELSVVMLLERFAI